MCNSPVVNKYIDDVFIDIKDGRLKPSDVSDLKTFFSNFEVY